VTQQIIRLFAQIALLQRGPQDLPASVLLLVLTIAGYLGVNFLVGSLLPPFPGWPPQLLVDALFTLLWYVALLRLLGRAERTLQTTTAVFGLQALLSPLLIASDWALARLGKDAPWQLPVAWAGLLLTVWVIAASSRIVRSALEWSSPASVLLVILQTLSGHLLLVALFRPVTT
jgi:hypothetical protein